MLSQDAWLGKSCPLSAMTLMSSTPSLCGRNEAKGQLCMCSPVKDGAVIDIIQSVKVHTSIVPDLLDLNALTGAGTSAATFGIGKIKSLKVARTARIPLHAIGDTADEAIVLGQATSFILACYDKGFSRCASMSEARIKM